MLSCVLPASAMSFHFVLIDLYAGVNLPPRTTGGAESTTITTVGKCQECCQASARTSSLSWGITFLFCHPFAEKDIWALSASLIVVQI